MTNIPTNKKPIHPGEILLEEFLLPMGITQKYLSKAIYVPFQRINGVVNGKRSVTPSTSLRLSKFFGVSEDFWMNLQIRWDLYKTKKKERKILNRIKPIEE